MKISLNQKHHHMKDTWIRQTGPIHRYSGPDKQYPILFDKYYKNFEGKILEIDPGDGYMANYILDNYKNIKYNILDIERNLNEIKSSYLKKHESKINYTYSYEYELIFKQEYDLLISNHCLSETPNYYYKDILNKIKVKNCFIIDESSDPNDLEFNDILKEWVEKTFELTHETHRNYNILGLEDDGTMIYIGKGA